MAQPRHRRDAPRPRGGTAAPARRAALLAALLLPGVLGACGFRLRGTQQLPFDSVYIEAPPTSAISGELARALRTGTSTRVVEDKAQAKAVIEIVDESRARDVLSVDAQGRAREYRIRLRVVYRISDPKGKELQGRTTINAARDLFAREEQLLAREYEEAQLYQDMLIDVAQQMLRRTAVLKV